MKISYENELRSLQSWIDNVNRGLAFVGVVKLDFASVNNTCNQIVTIAEEIEKEYPFYSRALKNISIKLFRSSASYNVFTVNNAAFGELYIIISHIAEEPVDIAVWYEIHPRIRAISQQLFCDGHYDSAAEKAIKEVETRLRELFQVLKPGVTVPAKVGDIIGALLTENGAYHFADLSTVSGKDYRRGIQSIFEGAFAAYRNPSSHENLLYTKREAMEQIMLASQLMYVLDK